MTPLQTFQKSVDRWAGRLMDETLLDLMIRCTAGSASGWQWWTARHVR